MVALWLKQGHTRTVMVEGRVRERNADTPLVTANSARTSKVKVTGEKRKRYFFDVISTEIEVRQFPAPSQHFF